jgi:hypothetical protein
MIFSLSIKGEEKFIIEFDIEIYDFGTVIEGEKVDYTYVFTNKGTETILIKNVRPGCGCTVTGKFDDEVKPGKKGKINVQLNTKGFDGNVNKVITVTTNIPGKESIILSMKGIIFTPIAVQPKSLWLGRIMKSEKSLTGTFTIKNNSETPLEILEIIPPHERTTVELTTSKATMEYNLEVTVNPPFQEKRVSEYIIVKTNIPEKERLTLRYSYDVQAELFVYPENIFIQPGPMKRKSEKYIRIQSYHVDPISILYPQVVGTQVDMTLKEEIKGKVYILTLTFPEKFELKEKEPCIVTFQVKRGGEVMVYNVPVKILKGANK